MILELTKNGLRAEQEKPLNVYYDDQVVGDFYADLFVENEIIVELKAVQNLAKEHEAQVVNYLKASNGDIGLLINFSHSCVEVKRKYRDLKQDGKDK